MSPILSEAVPTSPPASGTPASGFDTVINSAPQSPVASPLIEPSPPLLVHSHVFDTADLSVEKHTESSESGSECGEVEFPRDYEELQCSLWYSMVAASIFQSSPKVSASEPDMDSDINCATLSLHIVKEEECALLKSRVDAVSPAAQATLSLEPPTLGFHSPPPSWPDASLMLRIEQVIPLT